MKRRVLITGGAGFIGSHVVECLLSGGHKVTVLDNFSTGRPENLSHQKNNNNLTLIKADIAEPETIAAHFKGIDKVFHLAALADIVPSIVNPKDYYRSNVNGTFSVLEAARAAGVACAWGEGES